MSLFKRQRVIEMKKAGVSNRSIARELTISQFSVADISKRFDASFQFNGRPKSGRKSKLFLRDVNRLVVESNQYPKKTANQWKRDCNLDGKVSVDTVKRRLRDAGLIGPIAAKKPHISPRTAQRRRKWCIDRNHWNLTDWKK